MDDVGTWERLIGAVGVPAALLFFLMFAGWKVFGMLAPHIPTLVKAYAAQCEASVHLAEHSIQHTDMLGTIHGDVGEVKMNVARLVERHGGSPAPLGGAVATNAAPGAATVAKADPPSQGGNLTAAGAA